MSFAVWGSPRDRSWVLVRVGWLPAGSGLGCAGCGLSFCGVMAESGSWWPRVVWALVRLPWSCVGWVCFLAMLAVGPWGAFFWGGPPLLDCRWLGAGSGRGLVCLPVGTGGAGGFGWGLPLVFGGWGGGVAGRGLGSVECVCSLALSFV